jgi:hypothetical protein
MGKQVASEFVTRPGPLESNLGGSAGKNAGNEEVPEWLEDAPKVAQEVWLLQDWIDVAIPFVTHILWPAAKVTTFRLAVSMQHPPGPGITEMLQVRLCYEMVSWHQDIVGPSA